MTRKMTRKMTDEHKAKIAEAKRGKIVTDETRALMSAQALARKRLVCPHCLKECAANMARRWHFDNCKHKPDLGEQNDTVLCLHLS